MRYGRTCPAHSGGKTAAVGAGYPEEGGGNNKKDPGISVSTLTNREKTKVTDALRDTHPLSVLLSTLRLARSSYFYHRAALRAGDKQAGVRVSLSEIFHANYRCYG